MKPQPGPIGRSLQRACSWLRRAGKAISPGPCAWRAAAWGSLLALALILLVTAYGMFGAAGPFRFTIGALLFLGLFAVAGGILTLLWHITRHLPPLNFWVLACALIAIAVLALSAASVAVGVLVVGLGILAAVSLLTASTAGLARGGWRQASRVRRGILITGLMLGATGLVSGAAWLLDAGTPATPPVNAATLAGVQVEPLALPDPSRPGPYAVRTLFYGSGQDQHRPEYGSEADLLTTATDGSALVEGWTGLRTAYWGFGPDELPLNGRVWHPEGAGPFPLVLLVHGQHPMEDFSDTGFTYLGELLASQGFIAVSVDENFLNLSPLVDYLIVSSLKEEDDLRGWLVLEHLRLWRDWNASPGNPFYQRVAMDKIALIGHSRGGEAVAVAAAFNRLPCYPDDAALRFAYDFDIRAVVAFAPVDHQYEPTGRAVALEDVNYLVLHGAHDMDVISFQGAGHYARIQFSGQGDRFKAGLYIYGANHGQFNTGWGRKDLFEPLMRVFNLEQLMPAEQQQQIARVYVSAFLQAALRGEDGYRPLFRDARRGESWLPDTIYLNQYEDSDTQLVSTYAEDIDLVSTTLPGGTQTGENLTVWREQPVKVKWGDTGDHAVYLGWDATASEGPASYTIDLPQRGLALTKDSVLVFSLADASEDPTPDTKQDRPSRDEVIELTLEVLDHSGQTARLPLSHFSFLQPQLVGQLGKAAFMSPVPSWEAVFQHFEFALADFVTENPVLDATNLAKVRLLFDRTEAGVILLDDVGFRP